MLRSCARMGVAAAVLALPACTKNNPAFFIEPEGDSGGGASTTSATSTTTTADTTGASGSAGGTATATGPDATTEPGSATEPVTSTGPATSGNATATTTSSTGDPSTGTTGDDTGEPPPCGNGVHEPDLMEQCDNGDDNADNGDCTVMCQLNVCGDGLRNETGQDAEACDDGPANGAGLGFCSADCQAVVPEEMLTIRWFGFGVTKGNLRVDGNVNPGTIKSGDETCTKLAGDGYKILAVDGVNRRATETAWEGDNPIDWVLKPYQGYQNSNGQPIGITGEGALFGTAVEPVPFKFPLGGHSTVWTGLAKGWVTASDCNDWTSTSFAQSAAVGNAGELGQLFWGNGVSGCGNINAIYCVEQ